MSVRETAGRRGALTRVAAQAGMELRLLARNGEHLLVTLGIPVGLLVFFSVVDVLPTGPGRPVDFLVPGILALSVIAASMVSLGIATGFERFYLVLKRLGATPLRRRELVAAKIVAVLAVQSVQVAVVAGVAGAGLGWRPAGGPAGIAVAAGALVLGTAAFAGVGLAMAGRLRAFATLAVANAAFVVLLVTSGIVFPLDHLPGPVAAVSSVLPAAPLAEALRAALDAGRVAWGPLGTLAAWTLGAPMVAAAVFRWE